MVFCTISPLIIFQIALIRSFLFGGVESFKMMAFVEGIPTFLHVALVLFILGLIQFLFSVNLIVAGAVLGVFLFPVLLYCGMTIQPIIWAECPYRTPFSVVVRYAVIWTMKLIYKILTKIYYTTSRRSSLRKWSHLWRRRLVAIIPDYDIAVTREEKARDLSSKASKHRIYRDLRWTLDSLTTDSELEPFVAGLPTLLSVSAKRSESQVVSDAMIAILLEPYGLVARIARLLHTCIPPTILSDGPRIERATICLQAIYAICNAKKLITDRLVLKFIWRLEEGQFSAALLSFRQLDSHDNALSSEAVTISSLIATKMEAAAAAQNGEPIPSSVIIALSQILEQCQLLRLVVSDNEYISRLLDIFADILAHYSQDNREPSTEKQRWIQEFSQRIIRSRVRETSFPDFAPLSVVKSLVKFRDEKHLAVAQRGNCASACLAVHMQYHLLGYQWKFCLSNIVEALAVFGILLSEDPHVAGHVFINGELSLGIQFGNNKARTKNIEEELKEGRKWHHFKAKSIEDFEKAFSESSSVQYDRARLDELVVKDYSGSPVEVGYWGRIVINRGCTAILVIFLSSMKALPLPEDTLELTLETLQIITKSLTAGYSSSSTQTVLIHLIDRISKQLHAHLMLQDMQSDPSPGQGAQNKEEKYDPEDVIQEIPIDATDASGVVASISNITEGLDTTTKYILGMLQALLDVISTIAHPNSIKEARNVATAIRDNFTAHEFPTVHTEAVSVLAKV